MALATHLVGAARIPRSDISEEIIPLIDACSSGDLTALRQAFDGQTADHELDSYDEYKLWPLLSEAVVQDRPQIVSFLLDMGVPVSEVVVKYALEAKSTAIFEVLLEHNWDFQEPMSELNPPPLAFVVEDLNSTLWFLNHGANPNRACYLDLTPLSVAIRYSSIQTIELMFRMGGDINKGQLIHHAVQRDDNTIEVLDLLFKKGALIDAVMYADHLPSWNMWFFTGLGTVLHEAASHGKLEVISYLLQKGASTAILDSNGRTAFECAVQYNQQEAANLLQSRIPKPTSLL